MTFGRRRCAQAEPCRWRRQSRMSAWSVTRMKPSIRPPLTSFLPASGPCAPPESTAPLGARNGRTLADAVRHAHRRQPVLHRDPVGVRVGAEERVEGAVLLHEHDDVADLVDAAVRSRTAVARRRGAATRQHAEGEQERGDTWDESQLNGGWSGSSSGGRAFWSKSKSWTMLPRILTFSRT